MPVFLFTFVKEEISMLLSQAMWSQLTRTVNMLLHFMDADVATQMMGN
jgi:hypothetical protein